MKLQFKRMKSFLVLLSLVSFSGGMAMASVIPSLPIGIKSGAGAIINNKIYVGLGSAGNNWYVLDTKAKNKQWVELSKFPGAARSQATATALDGKIYVFGGVGLNKDNLTSVLLDSYVYDPKQNNWSKLEGNIPFGLVGHSAAVLDNKIILLGGVNQNIFNGYFIEAAQNKGNKEKQAKQNLDYFNKPIADYFFNRQVLSYDPKTSQWHNLGVFPSTGRAGATAVTYQNNLYYFSGEAKPGLRADQSFSATFKKNNLVWYREANVDSPEGAAGAYGGVSTGYVIFSGGAYFAGARAAYESGQYYAHKGLTKIYSNRILGYQNGIWKELGKLPVASGYGISIPYQKGILFIGGETDGGKALKEVYYVEVKNNKAIVK